MAVQAARFSGNSSRRLFFNTFLLGSLISMLLSNDATALIIGLLYVTDSGPHHEIERKREWLLRPRHPS